MFWAGRIYMNVLQRLGEEAKKEFWASLALRACEGMTPRLLVKILRHYRSAFLAYESLTAAQKSFGFGPGSEDAFAKKISLAVRTALNRETWREKALKEWQEAQRTDCEVILWTDYRYPLALKRLPDAPPYFYAKGNINLLSFPALAVVGSRKADGRALQKAEAMAEELSSVGLCIVSGMALGIDCSAHLGALQGQGKTIAVLGTGINTVYPKQHAGLYAKIAEEGLIISEFSPFAEPSAQNFPVRNRLITGISEGVLIVEAALKSGSLITARLALEQNKNVYVCRPLYAMHSLGGQKLLDEGALAVDDCQSIIADLVPNLMAQYEIFSEKHEKMPLKQEDSEQDETEKHVHARKDLRQQDRKAECSELTAGAADYAVKQEQAKTAEQNNGLAFAEERNFKNPALSEHSALTSAEIKCAENTVRRTAEKTKGAQKKQENVLERETAVYVPHLKVQDKKIQNREAEKFLSRPKPEDNLLPLSVDFAGMAREILYKDNPSKKLPDRAERKNRVQKSKDGQKAKQSPSEIGTQGIPSWLAGAVNAAGSKEAGNQNAVTDPAEGNFKECSVLLPDTESAVVPILLEAESLTADEILLQLQEQGENTDMAALSAELLMLEVEGSIEKLAGGRYRICYE